MAKVLWSVIGLIVLICGAIIGAYFTYEDLDGRIAASLNTRLAPLEQRIATSENAISTFKTYIDERLTKNEEKTQKVSG